MRSPIIDFSAVSDVQGKYDKPIVLNLANKSIVAYTIPPLTAVIRCKSFPVLTRISTSLKVFTNPRIDQLSGISIQLLEFPNSTL